MCTAGQRGACDGQVRTRTSSTTPLFDLAGGSIVNVRPPCESRTWLSAVKLRPRNAMRVPSGPAVGARCTIFGAAAARAGLGALWVKTKATAMAGNILPLVMDRVMARVLPCQSVRVDALDRPVSADGA